MPLNTDNPVHADATIRDFYDRLLNAFGPQNWWPADSQVEIVVGAILTQNTSWSNVEYAIRNLKSANLLDWKALLDIDASKLSILIRPAGYYNLKAKRIKNFVNWLWLNYRGALTTITEKPLAVARAELLSVNGIGPETADSILLYALNQRAFVIDAYTGRILRRHGLADESTTYDAMQSMFERALPHDVNVYNEYHALIVHVGKHSCRPSARCDNCPLASHTHDASKR